MACISRYKLVPTEIPDTVFLSWSWTTCFMRAFVVQELKTSHSELVVAWNAHLVRGVKLAPWEVEDHTLRNYETHLLPHVLFLALSTRVSEAQKEHVCSTGINVCSTALKLPFWFKHTISEKCLHTHKRRNTRNFPLFVHKWYVKKLERARKQCRFPPILPLAMLFELCYLSIVKTG